MKHYKLKSLTVSNINTIYNKVKLSIDYKPHNDLIKDFFIHNQLNTNFDIVAAKLTLIDDFYNTNTFRYKKVMFTDFIEAIIKTVNIDKRIEYGDCSVVNDIVKGLSNAAFMLATVYCALHNRYVYKKDDFMIYSKINTKLISEYTFKYYNKTTRITQRELENYRNSKDYCGYNKVVDNFLNEMKVFTNNRKEELDLFLWDQRKIYK